MGNEISRPALPAGSAGIDVAELSDLTFEKTLGNGRFMKSIRARHNDGVVFVKVVVKPYPQMSLAKYSKAIRKERRALANVPNALGFKRDLENSANGYLVRQYQYSSLYDRLSTRPFLETVEKKWLAFQLLSAVRDCHAQEVYHGDIKMENILVTSWNWLYLVDFSSSFKPTHLPDNNPADFNYFFDSNRPMCYIAPERFLTADQMSAPRTGINWPMDIFSVGCVIAELFVERPLFSLSQLFKYRKGEYDPSHTHLSRIVDDDVREMVSHMIQVDPESRYTADDYLKFWRRKAFPDYFFNFLHQYMEVITDPSSGRAPVTSQITNLGETDDRIERVYFDFDKIAYFLGYESVDDSSSKPLQTAPGGPEEFPLCLDIPNNRHNVSSKHRALSSDDGTLIFSNLIASSIRNTARASSRIKACDLLLAFAERLTDEAKLDRVLPYLFSLLNDSVDLVRIAALRSLTQLLALVTVVSPVNAFIFPEYLLPMLESFGPAKRTNHNPLVRANYASCLASLAETAMRFLDTVQALRADDSLPTLDPQTDGGFAPEVNRQAMYDSARESLLEHFESQTTALLTDSDASVRRAFLRSVSRLCVFFGTAKASDVILTHLNTYLNDKDWLLKCSFFETIVGVATFVGSASLEDYILPLMIQALTDPEELVVEKVIRSLTSMASLGLFQRSKTWELVDVTARFTMHPNIWIREAAAAYVSAATTFLPSSDIICIVAPLIAPYLKMDISEFSTMKILDALNPPMSRLALEMSIRWSLDSDTSPFWKSARRQRTFTFGPPNEAIPTISAKNLNAQTMGQIPRNDRDNYWLNRMRNIGFQSEDDVKLICLREYIWRIAQSSTVHTNAQGPDKKLMVETNGLITLQTINVVPQNVILNDAASSPDTGLEELHSRRFEEPRSITDALLDASKTIDDPLARRKRSYANQKRLKEDGRSSSVPPNDQNRNARHSSSQIPSSHLASQDFALESADDPSPVIDSSKVVNPPQFNAKIDDGLISKNSSTKPSSDRRSKSISRKGSAVNLMSRRDLSKAVAETSTSPETALGTLESNSGKASRALSPNGRRDTSVNSVRHAPGHNYEGRDPTILKLLDQVSLETYPNDAAEFGTMVNVVSKMHPIPKNSGQALGKWRPEGILVAVFGEHTAPINRVVVSPDHAFFITASDDGSIKIWDTARLESNAAQRSRHTHKHSHGAKIKCVCFIEGSHSFVSAATDGSIHIVRVDVQSVGDVTKYSKYRLTRQYQLLEGEHAVWIEHFKDENSSILMVATNKSRVIAFDVRTMTMLYTLKNPVHHGTPTCFCLDLDHHWLLLATSHGILDFFDLRFRLRLKSWGLPGASPIRRLEIHPSRGKGHFVCVTGGTSQSEVTVWDVEKAVCHEVYRTAAPSHISTPKDTAKNYEPWKPDEDPPETILARFANSIDPVMSPEAIGADERSINGLTVGIDPEDATAAKTSSSNRSRGSGAFFLTAGSDRKLRYWDLYRSERSEIYSGLEVDEMRPVYAVTHPDTLTVVAERIPPSGPTAENAGREDRGGYSKRRERTVQAQNTRGSVVSYRGQELLKRHLDSVTDIALLKKPYGMTVSVDRSGIVYVFR